MTGASRSLVAFAILVSFGVGFKVDSFSLVGKVFKEEAVLCKDGEGISVFFAGVNPFFPACSKKHHCFYIWLSLEVQAGFPLLIAEMARWVLV